MRSSDGGLRWGDLEGLLLPMLSLLSMLARLLLLVAGGGGGLTAGGRASGSAGTQQDRHYLPREQHRDDEDGNEGENEYARTTLSTKLDRAIAVEGRRMTMKAVPAVSSAFRD